MYINDNPHLKFINLRTWGFRLSVYIENLGRQKRTGREGTGGEWGEHFSAQTKSLQHLHIELCVYLYMYIMHSEHGLICSQYRYTCMVSLQKSTRTISHWVVLARAYMTGYYTYIVLNIYERICIDVLVRKTGWNVRIGDYVIWLIGTDRVTDGAVVNLILCKTCSKQHAQRRPWQWNVIVKTCDLEQKSLSVYP